MEIKKEGVEKPMPQLIMGTIPCGTQYSPLHEKAWNLVQPYVDDMANKTNGEYTGYTVKRSLWFGEASLHLAYMDNSGKATKENSGEMIVSHLADPTKDFVGYIITRLDPQSLHIWQVFIMPEYQNTNAFKLGYKYLDEFVKMWNCPDVTLSSQREGWHKQCTELGFTELYTVYRKRKG